MRGLALCAILLAFASALPVPASAQEQTAAAPAAESDAPAPLGPEEMEVLVARIALYPDELVALVTSASLYPLQIVEAARFLDQYEKDSSLKPKESWDGSVVSLLNYPEIVRMMSDDLEWTQKLGDAIAWQQKDVLIAIQQLREQAVANGVIKSDDKVTVQNSGDTVVIQSANPDVVYVPQYPPEMLYVPDYAPVPISYYPDPYPNYWYPTATFFAGAVTGAAWAAAVDWDDWGVWGGNWNGNDIDIDCNNCFNNRDFNGTINFNDVDWKNVDRSKLKIDRDQLTKFDSTNIENRVERNANTSINNRASEIKRTDGTVRGPGKTGTSSADVRRSMQEGLKQPVSRPSAGANAGRVENRPAARSDSRPKAPSGLGNVDRGKVSKVQSDRGAKAMGGGQNGGGRAIKKPSGGGRENHQSGGGRAHGAGERRR